MYTLNLYSVICHFNKAEKDHSTMQNSQDGQIFGLWSQGTPEPRRSGLSFPGQQAAVLAEGVLPPVVSREGCSPGLTVEPGRGAGEGGQLLAPSSDLPPCPGPGTAARPKFFPQLLKGLH